MKLVASLIVRNELDRYLKPCIEHLLEFCDEVRVLDDASSDGGGEWLTFDSPAWTERWSTSSFFQHEGSARQRALDWALEAEPTHILCVDADEFVSDGGAIRAALERDPDRPVWTVCMEEVWDANDRQLRIRQDGMWRGSRSSLLFATPNHDPANWQIENKKLACGREPVSVRRQAGRAPLLPVSVYHFGWTCKADRAARHQRYETHDRGNFHARQHIASIMWDDTRVRTVGCPWPEALSPWKETILERANRGA